MCLQSWIDKMLGVAGTHPEEQADYNHETR